MSSTQPVRHVFAVSAAVGLIFAGCAGEDEPYRKPVSPVTGKIVVDGAPVTSPVKVECHPVGGMDTEHPSVSWCMSDDTGKFALSTYEAGDGVPPGQYKLTFIWGQIDLISMSYGGPDKLNDRYNDIAKSPKEFTVNEGEPLELGTIELTTK